MLTQPEHKTTILRPQAILFDCDGVIADSESVIARILADEITKLGWPMTPEEEQRRFRGMTGKMLEAALINHLGAVPEGWRARIGACINAALTEELQAVPGVFEVIAQMARHGRKMAVASNSGRRELELKLSHLGLLAQFEGRAFSAQDVTHPKPAPDIYLKAAAACGVAPKDCLVIEDTAFGARAGIAAGCNVFGFTREHDPAMAELDIPTFSDMRDLPALIGLDPLP